MRPDIELRAMGHTDAILWILMFPLSLFLKFDS